MLEAYETVNEKGIWWATEESKKKGGGKAPASPNAFGKVVADVIPASVNPLENQFDHAGN